MGDLWTEIVTNRVITEKLPEATLETLQMVGLSALITLVVGLPLGLLLRSLSPDGLLPQRTAASVLGFVVNVLRSLPFIILALALIPVTRAIVAPRSGGRPPSCP